MAWINKVLELQQNKTTKGKTYCGREQAAQNAKDLQK